MDDRRHEVHAADLLALKVFQDISLEIQIPGKRNGAQGYSSDVALFKLWKQKKSSR